MKYEGEEVDVKGEERSMKCEGEKWDVMLEKGKEEQTSHLKVKN